VATLAPLVDAAASEGDPVATHILNNAAQQLATLAASVRSQLWVSSYQSLHNNPYGKCTSDPASTIHLAYIGGVFHSRQLLERFRALVELDGVTSCAPPLYGPEIGALREAYRAAGLRPELRRV